MPQLSLKTVSGAPLSVINYVRTPVSIQNMGSPVQLVVSYLIMPAILGLDFLQQHGLALDFSTKSILNKSIWM